MLSRLERTAFPQLQTFHLQTRTLRLRLAVVLPPAFPRWRAAAAAGAATPSNLFTLELGPLRSLDAHLVDYFAKTRQQNEIVVEPGLECLLRSSRLHVSF